MFKIYRTVFLRMKNFLQLIFYFSMTPLSYADQFTAKLHAKEPAVAGIFYPKQWDETKASIEELYQSSPSSTYALPSSVIMIVPHAGYQYSGKTASRAYAVLRQAVNLGASFDHIILIGPCHKGLPKNVSVYWTNKSSGWQSTSGSIIPIDPMAENFARLLNDPSSNPVIPHIEEHSLEVQIPFLQTIFPKFSIIPILVNNPKAGDRLVRACLSLLKNKKVLYIISTDLSHYMLAAAAEKKDRHTLKIIKNDSSYAMREYLSKNDNVMCGGGAIYTGMRLRESFGLPPIMWTQYAQSAPLDSPKEEVVGYASGITVMPNVTLSLEEQEQLLQFAKDVLNYKLTNGHKPIPPKLFVKKAIFVTLYNKGQLRGCVGTTEATLPITEAVEKFVLESAFHDSRFLPVTANELKNITIEISVLSDMLPVKSYADIVPDQDGAVFEEGNHKGVFLPIVWKNFTRLEFFQELCKQKADLPKDCYKSNNTKISSFQVYHFQQAFHKSSQQNNH